MISNLDIERKKTRCDIDSKRNKKIIEKVTVIETKNKAKHNKILASKRYIKFMEKVLKRYAEGAEKIAVPLFSSRLFSSLVVEKFNSYDLENILVYDNWNREVFFVKRIIPS